MSKIYKKISKLFDSLKANSVVYFNTVDSSMEVINLKTIDELESTIIKTLNEFEYDEEQTTRDKIVHDVVASNLIASYSSVWNDHHIWFRKVK